MFITFVRHATAEDRATAPADYPRVLIQKGHHQVKRMQAFCQANALVPDVLFSSPYPRAMETAMGLVQLRKTSNRGNNDPQQASWLRLEANPRATIAHIRQLAMNTNDLWLTGHEPHLSAVITLLLCSQQSEHAVDKNNNDIGYMPVIKVRKASITRLEYHPEQHTAQILWSVPCAFMPAV